MKIFAKTSFKSVAAATLVMLFASSAVYATCQTDCDTYARTEAQKQRDYVYNSALASCSPWAGTAYCSQLAAQYAQQAYDSYYNQYYSQCTSTNCQG